MNNKTYKTIAIIALVVSIVGLVSFVGGIKPVNIGTFVFPLLVSGFFSFGSTKRSKPIPICQTDKGALLSMSQNTPDIPVSGVFCVTVSRTRDGIPCAALQLSSEQKGVIMKSRLLHILLSYGHCPKPGDRFISGE